MTAATRWGTLLGLGALLTGMAWHRADAYQSTPQAPQQAPPEVRYPAVDEGVDTLPERAKAQQAAASQIGVFHDFQFQDKLQESGIRFVHRAVDDAARLYKAVHYDHGNGIAAADVDGDGRTDLYFPNQAGSNELWRNLGNGRFENITAAPIAMAGRISVAASFADIDNDGDVDLFVSTVRTGNALFENDGHGKFRDITATSNLRHLAHSSGAMFFDYNHDGRLDLLVCDVGVYTGDRKGAQGQFEGLADAFSGHMYPERYEHPVLYQNLGNKVFRDVTSAMGLRLEGWCGDATIADFNADGWPDIYLLNMMGSDHYFENNAGKGFVDRTQALFPRTSWGAMGVKAFDYDNDGKLDLLVTDMHSDMFGALTPAQEKMKATVRPPESFLMGKPDDFVLGNALFHNLGGKFEEVSDAMGAENYWPWGPSIGDLNADGWEDAFVASSMNFPFRYGINSLLLNDRGRMFRDAEFITKIEPRAGGRTHTPWFTLDCANRPPDPQGFMRQMCEGRTGTVQVMATLGSRSSVLFDLDGDGDLDIVTQEFNSAPQVLISNLSAQRELHWIKLQLQGTASNKDGLGALVTVKSGDQTYTRYHDGKSGYLGQSSLPLYFGLGDRAKPDRIEVAWPSGRRQTITEGITGNTLLKIVEPAR